MKEFIDFILIDGSGLTVANLASFFAFCVVFGTVIMVIQASMNAGNFR
ncbi:hypothetical protein [Clostridium transplantifaecale]|nr:hypothetical protein [Clostridium transplantifaecale]